MQLQYHISPHPKPHLTDALAQPDYYSVPKDTEHTPSPLHRMDLQTLICSCDAESEGFFQGRPTDTRFAYELFRRALVEGDERAWDYVYRHYYHLVEHWVKRNTTFSNSGESSEFLISAAFIRFWQAVTPNRFVDFPTLASLLSYLQRCANCAVIDGSRAYRLTVGLIDDVDADTAPLYHAPDEEVIERMDRAAFWHYIDAQLNDDVERIVMLCSFVMSMKPADICDYRSDLFNDVSDVYVVKRRVLVRLRRNKELHRLLM